MSDAWPRALHVVVPCRDEAARLPRLLDSLAAAVRRVTEALPATEVGVTVVLDGCRDDSAAIVSAGARVHPWLRATEVEHGCVGAARAAGVADARGRVDTRPEHTWLAHTDADSQVPAHWLLRHAHACRDGADLWLGTVRPDADGGQEGRLTARWLAEHDLVVGHGHVHGANLGVRLSAYDAAGGFAPLPLHEDVALVRRVVADGGRVVADDRAPVLTSARLSGRVRGGFATYLATLMGVAAPVEG